VFLSPRTRVMPAERRLRVTSLLTLRPCREKMKQASRIRTKLACGIEHLESLGQPTLRHARCLRLGAHPLPQQPV